MALTTVAELRSTLGVGTLYPDATLQEVCDATDAVLLPMLWANTNFAVSHENKGTVGTLYFEQRVDKIYYVGQSVVITGAGSHFNGNKTITGVNLNSITITTNHVTDTPEHPFNPYASVKASTAPLASTPTAALKSRAVSTISFILSFGAPKFAARAMKEEA